MSMPRAQLGHLGGGSARTRSQLWTKPVMISRLQLAFLLRTGNVVEASYYVQIAVGLLLRTGNMDVAQKSRWCQQWQLVFGQLLCE